METIYIISMKYEIKEEREDGIIEWNSIYKNGKCKRNWNKSIKDSNIGVK